MWRDGQSNLASRLERTGGRGRQFVMRSRLLVIHVPVNDELIAEPLVIEGHKSTVVFNLWIGARELVEVEQSRMSRLYEKAASAYDARVVAFFLQALPLATEKSAQKKR